MTAVEYLIELLNFDGYVSEDTINKAKEMEKQQIIQAYVQGCNDTYGIDEPNANPNYDRQEGEQYYNQTYKTTP